MASGDQDERREREPDDLERTVAAWGESLVALAPTSKRAIVLELRGEKNLHWSSQPMRRDDVPLLHVSFDAARLRDAIAEHREPAPFLQAARARVRGDVGFMGAAVPVLARWLAQARKDAR